MKVLHLTTHLNIGGITTYLEGLILPLQKLGVETFVVTNGGERIPAFRARGAKVVEIPILTKNAFHPKLFLALPKIARLIKENSIDMLHAHSRVTQVLAALLSWMTGVPVVSTCHGFFKLRLGRKLFPCWGDRVIAISGMVRDHLINDFKVSEERVRLIPNAVNLEELEAAYAKKDAASIKRAYGFDPKDPVVGITARLVDDKGHEYLLRSVPLIKKQFPGIRILIVGDGRCRAELEKLSADLNIQQHVHFAGMVTDITESLAAMDIFALPATWREGFGLSIVEAMACRKPIIVSNIWALNTLVSDHQTGLIVEPKKIEPLAQAILTLLTDSKLAEGLTRQAYQLVKDRYAIQRMAQELSSLYQELCPRKP